MCIKTDTEIQQQLVSSVGGAIAEVLCVWNALVQLSEEGLKQKKLKPSQSTLIITYMNNQNELAYIGFDVMNNLVSAYTLMREFNKLNTNSGAHIDL